MKIAVLLSGGVDSSVALSLLAQQGHKNITAFYLKIWLEDELSFLASCPWQEDLEYAKKTCDRWNVPLEVIPFQGEYRSRIINYTLEELKKGRTPSPDVYCNERIKFGSFCEKTLDYGFDAIASGHYAQIRHTERGAQLVRAQDPVKDQTYFLAHLHLDQLQRIMFPIGHLFKRQVRALAEEFDLANQSRKDSQGLCFLGKVPFDEFIRYHLGDKPGLIKDIHTDKVLGKHRGYWYHTIGQRRGLGLSGGPWKVVRKDVSENIIYVGHALNFDIPMPTKFHMSVVNFTVDPDFSRPLSCKVRHGTNEIDVVTMEPLSHERFFVQLKKGDAGLASGQFAAFYQDDICIGSGVMELS